MATEIQNFILYFAVVVIIIIIAIYFILKLRKNIKLTENGDDFEILDY